MLCSFLLYSKVNQLCAHTHTHTHTHKHTHILFPWTEIDTYTLLILCKKIDKLMRIYGIVERSLLSALW